MKLYGYWRSSCSWRVRIALELKAIDYEYCSVHLVRDGGEQHFNSFKEHNPMAQVPMLELTDGTRLLQSIAIIEYLEESHPDPHPLLPKDHLKRAKARGYTEIINSGIQPLQNLSVLQAISQMGQDKMEWGQQVIAKGLIALDHLVRDSKDTYLVGNTPTIADICLIPQLYNARRFKCDLDQTPSLLKIEKRCEELTEFKRAHPSRMPDAH